MLQKRRISKKQADQILNCFCLDIDATRTSFLAGVNRNTANTWFGRFRLAISKFQKAEREKLCGIIELDESYFGGVRKRGCPGKRGRGTNKQPVFGILERSGRVYTEIVDDCSAKSLLKIVKEKVSQNSLIQTDKWRGYDGLVHMGYNRHFRINHSKRFCEKGVHINGIEAFWSFTKRRLTKFNGVKKNFLLHLKECEWRWNKDYDKLKVELTYIIKKFNP